MKYAYAASLLRRELMLSFDAPKQVCGAQARNCGSHRVPSGAILLERNVESGVQRARYRRLGTIAPLSHNPIVGSPAVAS